MRLLSWSILPVITISRPWIWTSASWARVVLITLCWRRFMTSLTVWRIVWVILSGKQLIEKMCRKRVEVAYAEKSGEERDSGIIWIWFLKSPRPSLPLKRAPPLTPTLSPSGEREETAPPRRSEPLRSKVGGASKPSPCCAGWDRRGWEVYNLQFIINSLLFRVNSLQLIFGGFCWFIVNFLVF